MTKIKTTLKLIKSVSIKTLKCFSLLGLILLILQTPITSAFLADVETAIGNDFSADTLVVGMRSGQSNFTSDPLDLEPGDSVARDIYVQKLGNADMKYKSEFEMLSGDTELCEALELKVWYNWYDAAPPAPGDHSTRHMDLKYDGLLSNFSDFDTSFPTHDPDMQLLNTHAYFTNIFYASNEHWFYYRVTLPGSAGPELKNLNCNFNIKTTGWQTSMLDDTLGFTDVATLESTVATGNWHTRSISGLKFDDSNNNGAKETEEVGLEDWSIKAGRLLEEHYVASSSITPVLTSVLETGKEYALRVSDTFGAGDSITADAQYSVRLPNINWTDEVQTYESYGPTLLDLQINGSSPNWGSYNSDHVYWLSVSGSDAALSLLINDIYYPNNTGFLHVEIYEIVATTTTAADGTYNLDLSGQLGDLIIFEVWQDGWHQTLPTTRGYYSVGDTPTTTDQDFGNYLYEMQEANDIVLNEILYDPTGSDDGTMPAGEWVELYNNTGSDVDVAGWTVTNEAGGSVIISTSNSDNDLDTADAGETVVPASAHLTVYLNSTDFMTNDGDTITLFNTIAELQDRHTYVGGKPEGNTEARIPDGVGAWIDPVATPGRNNVSSTDYLDPMIRVWQQEPMMAKFSLFDAINYDTASYELSYTHSDNLQEMITGQITIDEMREDVTSVDPDFTLYFGTCSTGGTCAPHQNVDADSINLKIILQGAGLPERTLETNLTGEWL